MVHYQLLAYDTGKMYDGFISLRVSNHYHPYSEKIQGENMYLIARVSVQTNKGKYSVLEIPNYHTVEKIFESGGFNKDFNKSSLIRYLDTLHDYAQFGKITTEDGTNPDHKIQKHPIWKKLGISDNIKKLTIQDSVIMQDEYEYGEEERSITIDLINATYI